MKVYEQIVRGCIDCPNRENYSSDGKWECRCKKVYHRNRNYRLVHEEDYTIRDENGVLQGFGYPDWCPLEDA